MIIIDYRDHEPQSHPGGDLSVTVGDDSALGRFVDLDLTGYRGSQCLLCFNSEFVPIDSWADGRCVTFFIALPLQNSLSVSPPVCAAIATVTFILGVYANHFGWFTP